jgi:hypothetical protein
LITGNPGVPFLLDLQLYDGSTSAYVKAYLRNSIGAIFQQSVLSHVGLGLYTSLNTISAVGSYTVQLVVYSDAGFSVEDLRYMVAEDQIKIDYLLSSQTSVDSVQTSVNSVSSDIATLSTHIDDLISSIDADLENSSVSMTTGVVTTTGTQEILAWLEVNSVIIMNPVSCTIVLQDGSGNTVHNFGLNSSPLANGFFQYTQPGANVTLVKGHTYLAVISIVHGIKTYSAIRALTVLF